MSSCRIWIPSKQKYERFSEIGCEQYRNLLKCIDDDIDFDYTLNRVLIENIEDRSVNVQEYTIIDRFIIFLQLKIHSHNSQLKLMRICNLCEAQTDFSIDLNKVIETLAGSIDKSFHQSFNVGPIIVMCDVPTIRLVEDSAYDRTNIDERLNHYLYSFISGINITGTSIQLAHRADEERNTICSALPYDVMLNVKDNYVDVLHKTFKDLLLISNRCSNTKCNDQIILNFDINNMLDAIKILFKDDSAVNVLGQYTSISSKCHFDYNFYKNITPLELSMISDMVQRSETPPEAEAKTNNDIDLFEQYRSETAGMVESPSEFE